MQESNTQTNSQPDPVQDQAELCIDINRMHDIELNEDHLCEIVAQILKDHDVESAEISLAIVSDDQIHDLNRQYLQHDYETDVLSFDLGSDSGSIQLAGEVVVSAETAIRCAREHGIETIDELALYVIHGTLHLVGHDDKTDDARMQMREAEQKYANQFGLKYCDPDKTTEATDGVG